MAYSHLSGCDRRHTKNLVVPSPALGGQAAHARWGAKNCCEYRQVAQASQTL